MQSRPVTVKKQNGPLLNVCCQQRTAGLGFENVIQVNEGSAYHSVLHYSSELGHLKLYNYNKMVAGTDQR